MEQHQDQQRNMWESKAQAAWGHSPSGLRALGGKSGVAEWDASTPKGTLPDRAGKKRQKQKHVVPGRRKK